MSEVRVRHEMNGTIGMKDETTAHSDDDDIHISPIVPTLCAAKHCIWFLDIRSRETVFRRWKLPYM